MRVDELMVLDGLNIASVLYRRDEPWWTRAEDIARVIREDERLKEEYDQPHITTRQVGYILRRMRGGWPRENRPLVEVQRCPHRDLWCMSKRGLTALCA